MVLTGPRQAGKTTLARAAYPDLRYWSLDVAEDRAYLAGVRTRGFATSVGEAILDEAQKEPALFEKVKFAYDEGAVRLGVLLGSAQILLLRHISETLAGRALLYELLPLGLGELAAGPGVFPGAGLLEKLLAPGAPVAGVLDAESEQLPSAEEEPRLRALEHLAEYGGMPGLLPLSAERRRDWLASYTRTYLERDLADLARLSDLAPFRTFQRLAALRAARLLSYADLARDAGVSPTTARNYLEYLRISYQAFLLQPWHVNLTSALVKTPKLYWFDVGILRHLAGMHGPLTGELFENLVVAEIVKWLRTSGSDVWPWAYRTRSGLEVDLLLENQDGILALEIKNRAEAAYADASGLRRLAAAAGDRWRGGLVVTRGVRLHAMDPARRIYAVPAHRLLA